MEITGTLAGNAEIRKTRENKEVVSFTVAVNDYYKPKDGEAKKFTEFINCSYWMGTKIAETLIKGSVVTVSGRIYLNQFTDKDGNHHAYLAFHCNGIKIIAKAKKGTAQETVQEGNPENVDDLPF